MKKDEHIDSRDTVRMNKPDSFAEGSILDRRYMLGRILGKGTYGTVYKARDMRLDLDVAVKILTRSPDSAASAAWEVKFSRMVSHPSIARVFDIGGSPDGVRYLVMELVEGRSLAVDGSQYGLCSAQQALFILNCLCPALEEAAARGLLHGDIKPGNIMEKSTGGLSLVDFGTTFLIGSDESPLSGTPAYMAPEVLSGNPCTLPSEIYSLGASLYELLTGHIPHESNDVESLITMRKDPPPPCVERMLDHAPALAGLVDSMIHPDPRNRPATFLDVLQSARSAARQLQFRMASAVLAQLWSGRAALMITRCDGDERLANLLLEQNPDFVFVVGENNTAVGTVRNHGYRIVAPHIFREHAQPGMALIVPAELDACSFLEAAHKNKALVVGPADSPDDLPDELFIAHILSDQQAGWSQLRRRHPHQPNLVLPFEDVLHVITHGIEPIDRTPAPARGLGPYTRKQHDTSPVPNVISRKIFREILEHTVIILAGPPVSGRTTLALTGLVPQLSEAGWSSFYIPRYRPVDRILTGAATPGAPGREGRVIIVDDHASWPHGTTPWDDSEFLRELKGRIDNTGCRLLFIVPDHDTSNVSSKLHAHGYRNVGISTMATPSQEQIAELLQRGGMDEAESDSIASELVSNGWLPWDLQLMLRWITKHGAKAASRWSLRSMRREYLQTTMGRIAIRWQGPLRDILSALVTGSGVLTLDEPPCDQLPKETLAGFLRKMATFRLFSVTYRDGRPALSIPVPSYAGALLELLGPEYLRLKALRQFLDVEMATAKEFGTDLDGSRFMLLSPLRESGLLTQSESAFLIDQEKKLQEKGDAAVQALETFRAAESEYRNVNEQLQEYPDGVPDSLETETERKWKLSVELESRKVERRLRWEDAVVECHRALAGDPDNPTIRSLLAELHWNALLFSEDETNWAEAQYHRELVLLYGNEEQTKRLKQGAHFMVDCTPEADVLLQPLDESEPVFRADGEPSHGRTPYSGIHIPAGSYIALLTSHRYAPALLTLNLRTGRREQKVVTMFPKSMVGEDFIHIPAGRCSFGGDPGAPGSDVPQKRYVGDFALSRMPVTFRQYCQFLNHASKEEEDIEDILPRDEEGNELVMQTSSEEFLPIPSRLSLDSNVKYRGRFELEIPAVGISWDAAMRYCTWLGTRERRSYRLPLEVEWEKAARGSEGRVYPWGNGFHPHLCKMRDSRKGPPGMEPIGVFTEDVSPYGVRDMAGSVSEWCSDLEAGMARLRVVRGGSWLSMAHECRAASRQALPQGWHGMRVGFRICFSLPAGE